MKGCVMLRSRKRFLTALFVAFLVASGVTWAQSTQGSLIGRVQDQSGAVIKGAKVTVNNESGGSSHDTLTDSKGAFQILNLEPSHYRIVVAMPGFDTRVEDNLL